MKAVYRTLAAAGLIVFLSSLWVFAEAEQKGGSGRGQGPIPEERFSHMLQRVAAENPERAAELEKLRAENPEEFRKQLRVTMRDMFGDEGRGKRRRPKDVGEGNMPGMMSPMMGPGPGLRPGPMGPGMMGPGRRGEPGGRMGGPEDAGLLMWLKENEPEKAAELEQLKKDNPEMYERRLRLMQRQYRRIMQASKDNPELATVLKEDLQLKRQRNELVKQIRGTEDQAEAEKLKAELKTVIGKRFDLIIKKKQLQYEDLQSKLEKLKKEVEQRKGELEKMKGDKETQIKERFEKLISATEKIDWE
ncbi:MAG: hypothetical protein ABIG61_02445 [Planctomycetota bacterium]